MKLSKAAIRNFRRLENVTIDVEEQETVFVGPNNSGKTSATAIFRAFLGSREFKIHDFSVARIPAFDEFGMSLDEPVAVPAAEAGVQDSGSTAPVTSKVTAVDTEAIAETPPPETPPTLPEISLDLWFTIDPESIAFGRVYTLLQNLSDEPRVGLRLTFGVDEPKKLRADYLEAYEKPPEGARTKTLFEYLSLEGNLARYCVVRHYSLSEVTLADGAASIKAVRLDPEEGKRLVKNLVRAEFVDAQRNINDDEGSRANRLSSAFASYYRKNLQQVAAAAEAHRVIDANNDALTAHYGSEFKSLMALIRGLGVPSINDRELQIISALSPEVALKGSTELIYVDAGRNHRLPEPYNGLGFKNLIYMAIQARHFHSQWLATTENRPLCLLIFIEEPEVHLHAQVQQTFINNIWGVINDSAKEAGEPELTPQVLVTTHSSHILDTVDFEKVRYFQRCYLEGEAHLEGVRNASIVRSLRAFRPEDEKKDAAEPIDETDDGQRLSTKEILAFLQKYLRLTHCDLFFADAAILVEGAVEKLLMPSMIDKVARRLRGTYLTVLEVGGAYAHRFEELLSFLNIPYLIVTDLDSVAAKGYPSACRGDTPGARTSNACLKKLCNARTVAELLALTKDDKCSADRDRCIVFQTGIEIEVGGAKHLAVPRTLEEAIAYENLAQLRAGTLSIGIDIPTSWPDLHEDIYVQIRADKFKKTAFAMSLLTTDTDWTTPSYITEGLQWLEGRLSPITIIGAGA